jgi:hypothetical protein
VPDFITLSCPSCGGKLEVTKDLERFACAHCGTEHIVRRTSSTISLDPVTKVLEKVQDNTGRTAAELAIPRLKTEVGQLERRRMALVAGYNANEAAGAVASAGSFGAKKLGAVLLGVAAVLISIFLLYGVFLISISFQGARSIGHLIAIGLLLVGCIMLFRMALKLGRRIRYQHRPSSAEAQRQHSSSMNSIDSELARKRGQLEESLKLVSG